MAVQGQMGLRRVIERIGHFTRPRRGLADGLSGLKKPQIPQQTHRHFAKVVRVVRATDEYIRTFAAPALWADLKWVTRSFFALPARAKLRVTGTAVAGCIVALSAMAMLYDGEAPEYRFTALAAAPAGPIAPAQTTGVKTGASDPAATQAAAVPEKKRVPSGLATYPSLNTWSETRIDETEKSRAALSAVEFAIAARAGGQYVNLMTVNPELMKIQARALQDKPLHASVFQKGTEYLGLALARIDRLDASVLIDACGDEERIRIAGLDFVRMSTGEMPGFSAMLPRANGEYIMIRSTLPADEVQKLVTRERLKSLGYGA